MPLSIEKLKKLFKYNDLIPVKYYTMHNICIMIEVINIRNGENYIIYIPSKYEFYIKDNFYS